MPKATSKKTFGVGHVNPVGQFKDGVGTLKNVFGNVADVVGRVAHPKKGRK